MCWVSFMQMESTHPLYFRKRHKTFFKKQNKTYTCRPAHALRIGSMELYDDLVNLGLKPRKSLDVELPDMPQEYFRHFVRGYFDGDGCIYLSRTRGNKKGRVRVIFTCGSKEFLNRLNEQLKTFLGLTNRVLYRNSYAYQLVYSKREALRVLDFMYKDANRLYLNRKHKKYVLAFGGS